MITLDRTKALPLWAQLLADLRSRLASGEFAASFPTDEVLRSEYQVSRQTVREAIRRLQNEGAVVRERGRGTMLASVQLEQPLGSLYSLARTIESQGHRERSELRCFELAEAGPVGEVLDLNATDEVVQIERLRLLDDEPLSFEQSWLPAHLARGLLDVDITTGSLYDVLRSHCNIFVNGGWERISPINPPEVQRRILHLPFYEVAFRVERLALADGDPIEWRVSLVRGDRYSFIAEW